MRFPVELVSACNLCGSPAFEVHGVQLGSAELHPILVRCAGCGLYYANPRATREELRGYYQRFYDGHEYLDTEKQNAVMAWARRRMFPRIKKHQCGGRFLDIGCGLGLILRAAREEGFEAIGVELCEKAAQYGQERFGLDIRVGTVEEARFDDSSFDVVYAWHVIEHVYDVKAFVSELVRILKPGGLLILGTENYTQLLGQLLRRYYMLLGHIPRVGTDTAHTFLFSHQRLGRLMKECGLDVVHRRVYWRSNDGELFRIAKSRNPLKAAVKHVLVYGLYHMSRIAPVGGLIEMFARKNRVEPRVGKVVA